MMNAKKSVLCLITCLLGSQAEAQDAQAEKPARQPSTEDRFEVRNLEGWAVYINRDVPRLYPEQVKKDGGYKSVLRFDGQRVPHPALVSERRYLA